MDIKPINRMPKMDFNGVSGKIKLEVYSKTGELLQRIEEEMHSYVSNFTDILMSLLLGNSSASIQDVGGNVQTLDFTHAGFMNIKAPSGNDNYGILIGTGTTQASATDTNLENKIANSVMNYGAVSITSSQSGNTLTVSPTRSFTNVSGSTQNVSEVGIVAEGYNSNTGSNFYYLLTHDILSTAASVPNNGTLNVEVDLVFNPSS